MCDQLRCCFLSHRRYERFIASNFLDAFLMNLSVTRSCDLEPRPPSEQLLHYSTPLENSKSFQRSDTTRYLAPSDQDPFWISSANASSVLDPGFRRASSVPLEADRAWNEQRFLVEDDVFGELGWSLLMTLLVSFDLLMFIYRLFHIYLIVTTVRSPKTAKAFQAGGEGYSCDSPRQEPSRGSGLLDSFHEGNTTFTYHEDSPADEDRSKYYLAFQTQFPQKTSVPDHNPDTVAETFPRSLFRILWDAILDRAVVPELAVAGFITTLLLTGMGLVADSSVRLRFETSAWVRAVGGLNDQCGKGYSRDDDVGRMDLEGSIRSEMIYLDAMIAHLCAGEHT